MADHAARVRKGAALLDERVPGWAHLVNRLRLNISDGYACVLAQVTGKHYVHGLRLLSLHYMNAPEYGFAAATDGIGGVDEEFDRLTECWHEEIAERVKALVPA